MKTMLFNPHSGKPRDPSDIASDPQGLMMVDPDEPVRAALAAQADAPRGTDAQILKERELTASAIQGAIMFGYRNEPYPPDDAAWLRPFWDMGRRNAEREAALAAQAGQSEPVAWMWEVVPGSEQDKYKGGKSGVYLEDPASLGIPIPHPSYKWTKLYTHPAPVRQPLSDGYVIDLLVAAGHVTADQVQAARDIAHGITAQGDTQ